MKSPGRKPRVALLTNLVSPYRRPVFARMARQLSLTLLHGKMESNRPWPEAPLPGACDRVVAGWTFRWTRRLAGRVCDRRYLHIEPGYIPELLRARPEAIITIEIGFRTAVALIYGALFRIPVWVWWGGTLHTEQNLSRLRRTIRFLAARCVRHWISYGATSTEYLLSLGVPRRRILQIQNCVDEAMFPGNTRPALDLHPKPVLLHAGRLVAGKGVAGFLETAARLQKQGASFSILLVGGGPDEALLRRRAAQLQLRNLHFVPSQPPEAMASFYRSADVLVFPTLDDVWGLVANEAILSGLPVLCSKYAGCAQELFGEECIFDPADPDAFADALRRAIAGTLPLVPRSRLLTAGQVGDMIAAAVLSELGLLPQETAAAAARPFAFDRQPEMPVTEPVITGKLAARPAAQPHLVPVSDENPDFA